MSSEYIDKEVDKVMKGFPTPLNLAMSCAWILGNFKGKNLKVIDVRKKSTLADYFVLASSTNHTQAQSMADEIGRQARKHHSQVLSVEGKGSADWILIDLGIVIIHVFSDHARDIFNLDHLYADSATVEIPQEYYTSTPSVEEDEGGRFF
jgi:ribosome-associated protein